MNDIDITLYLNEYRVQALADALGSQTAETVEDKLTTSKRKQSVRLRNSLPVRLRKTPMR